MKDTLDESLAPWHTWHGDEKPRLGVSSCLLGEPVRYDASHKRDAFLVERLGRHVEFVPLCPEVEIGLGVPRPTIQLEQSEDGRRLVCPTTAEDLTERMNTWAHERAQMMVGFGLDGYVFKSRSPSCGLARVPLLRLDRSGEDEYGVGMFAEALRRAAPHLALEEEHALSDSQVRAEFLLRLFAHHRWRRLVREPASTSRLAKFHLAHEYLLRAHDEEGFRRAERWLWEAPDLDAGERVHGYGLEFHRILQGRTTVERHVKVFDHTLRLLDIGLNEVERQSLAAAVDEYGKGRTDLSVPRNLLHQVIEQHETALLRRQLYFAPHPAELELAG